MSVKIQIKFNRRFLSQQETMLFIDQLRGDGNQKTIVLAIDDTLFANV